MDGIDKELSKMLVLTRKVGASIVIDDQIRIQVLGIKGQKVRIGIDASQDIPVHREEVHQLIPSTTVVY